MGCKTLSRCLLFVVVVCAKGRKYSPEGLLVLRQILVIAGQNDDGFAGFGVTAGKPIVAEVEVGSLVCKFKAGFDPDKFLGFVGILIGKVILLGRV